MRFSNGETILVLFVLEGGGLFVFVSFFFF